MKIVIHLFKQPIVQDFDIPLSFNVYLFTYTSQINTNWVPANLARLEEI